ncbi:Tn3 family transposase [Salibacterium halotolerans]|uniref:Transposase and inactivated derivatives, TnpA family n=1 Tax=Salibacterium halotolerans TaxID=1884432 RepID=A0A1I5SCD6_9BACI|nr:Tn3 family transposase [Salibacterium halotolerans]SFP68381.1 Transposase and inactivated derivatives, TnpA family [Salibacterium halotolerans]
MSSIDRTAYPRFKLNFSKNELNKVYTPTLEELQWIRSIARGSSSALNLTVLLKCFQNLGYFPRLDDIPHVIITHIRDDLHLDNRASVGYQNHRTLYRHYRSIREYVNVRPFGRQAQRVAMDAIRQSAETMDHPADLVSVAVAELVNHSYELPAFSTLDRLARRIRRLINEQYFQNVFEQLPQEKRQHIEQLLYKKEDHFYSPYNRLKHLPKKPNLSQIKEQIDLYHWLLSFGDGNKYLEGIPPVKIKHFAGQAKVLDVQEIKDFSDAKRYTLVLSLINDVQMKTRDNLATMLMKRMGNLHNSGKDELEKIRNQQREKTEHLVSTFTEVLYTLEEDPYVEDAGQKIKDVLEARGNVRTLLDDCEAVASYHGNNYLPLILKFFRSYRSTLFRLVETLTLTSTSQDTSVLQALGFIIEHRHRKTNWLPDDVDLSFATEQWKRTMRVKQSGEWKLHRRHLEVCVFSYIAQELKTGDICVQGSEAYADYRDQLLSWDECQPMLEDYCQEMGFPIDAKGFVKQLKVWMTQQSKEVEHAYPQKEHVVTINDDGQPILKKPPRNKPGATFKRLETSIEEHMPEHHVIDMLGNVDHWVNWSRHFGPLSGSDPKLERPKERYILNTFTHGCNLGPNQAARHMRENITPKTLSFVHQRHVTTQKLDKANQDIINAYATLDLPQRWGTGQTAAADGTQRDTYENNLLAENHIRYGGYGGIAYHHISDNYIALFSHFIPCGVWEAVYIIEGLLQNESDVQPDKLFADTQGQSTPVFALSYLLGIQLMPRIRNIKALKFYRPTKDTTYEHIDALFSDAIDWPLIETHWQDLMRVVLSIKAGKMSSPLLLRKLSNYSRKNRLYQAFRELGRVVRTVFLLFYISDMDVRKQITAETNKVEAFHGFSEWLSFGGKGIIATNDPEQQEKIIKYNELVSNALIFHNVVDLTNVLRSLSEEGYEVHTDDISHLSPYLMSHIKRFGEYTINLEIAPHPVDGRLVLD